MGYLEYIIAITHHNIPSNTPLKVHKSLPVTISPDCTIF